MFVHETGMPGAPTIVFLHGNGANGTMWKPHMAQLAEYHCVAPDFPGFGRSRHLEWVSLASTAEEIINLAQERTPQERVSIVGLSLGASLAMVMLGLAPHLVDHAIIDGAGVQPLPGLPVMKVGLCLLQPFMHTDLVIRAIAGMIKIPSDDYEDFRRGMLSMSPSSFTRSFIQANMMRVPPGFEFENVASRVLFVAGEREPEPVRQSQALFAQRLPNAESRIAPRMGHGWLAEAPDLHLRMVRAWLQDGPLPQELARAREV